MKSKTISKNAKTVLTLLLKDWEWIAMNKNGDIKLFEQKPVKDISNTIWQSNYKSYSLDTIYPTSLFESFLSWDDKEPMNIEYIISIISKEKSQVGKYIDINGDGIPEGVIFVDLAIGSNGQIVDDEGNVDEETKFEVSSIPKQCLKDYIVIGTYYDKINGEQEVLQACSSGEDRFYIMSLLDFSSNDYCWYYTAGAGYAGNNGYYDKGIIDYNTITSETFGKGKDNTKTMISKWNSKAYGEQNQNPNNYKDLWGEIQREVDNGWFVPSIQEWIAFVVNLNIMEFNYSNKGLNDLYWASSLVSHNFAHFMNFYFLEISFQFIDAIMNIRLATTI